MTGMEDEASLEEWVAGAEAFAFCREPGERVCRGLRASASALRRFDSFRPLAGLSGFVLAPFLIGGKHPVWLLPDGEEACFPLSRAVDWPEVEAPAHVPFCGTPEGHPGASYEAAFRCFSAALRSGRFRKLVLSRSCDESQPSGFSWVKAFCAACRRYVHSYVYLFYTPFTGYWLGATPEILLTGEGRDCRTMALAGTQFLKDGRLPGPWSEKNVREQALVTEYISGCLRARGLSCVQEGPYTATAGELAHLRTDLRFSLPAAEGLSGLVEALHPTPAVCGLPEQEAFRFILSHEGYDRSYYSGFLGRWAPGGRTALYVNLRCMWGDVPGGRIRLYAGGGLLSESVLEDEWMETERKLQTMKYVISKGIPEHVSG